MSTLMAEFEALAISYRNVAIGCEDEDIPALQERANAGDRLVMIANSIVKDAEACVGRADSAESKKVAMDMLVEAHTHLDWAQRQAIGWHSSLSIACGDW